MTACVSHLYHWKIHTKNMWSQRTPTQNHPAHEPDRLVQSSTGNLKLWSTVLQCQLDILVFMRSIRAGNFTLYIQTLTKFVHWFFTFDHYHYVLWISVHIREVMTLSHLHPQHSWRDTSQTIRVMCFQTLQSINHMTNIMLVWRMMVELLA